MRKAHVLAPLAALALAAAALPARADTIMLTTGHVDLDEPGFEPATVASIRIADDFADAGIAELDLGIEYAQDIEPGTTATGADWSFQSLGIYLSARTDGPLYLIGRIGVAEQEVEIGNETREATQQSVGIGIGVRIGGLQIEVIANEYNGDEALEEITWISAGIRF